jgi:hypothetical protein
MPEQTHAEQGRYSQWQQTLDNEIRDLAAALSDPDFDWSRPAVVQRLARDVKRIFVFMKNGGWDLDG